MRDRTFAATVPLGLAGAALAAVAAGREWARASGEAAGVKVSAGAPGSDAAPLVLALALVALAAWGVLLVLRGGTRRVVAVIGAVAAAGVLVGLVDAFDAAQNVATDAVVARGTTGDVLSTSLTGWYWATWVGGLVTFAALLVAVLKAPSWPAMGSRYDAPATRAARPATEEDLWRAIDQGHDPTA